MPLWSNEELATQHCTEEWADYVAIATSLADWLEFWIDELVEDDLEIDLPEFTQALVDIGAL